MKYIGKRLPQHKYQNSVLVYTSNGFLLEPFYGRNYMMPFNWGIKHSTFATTHLVLSILADYFEIEPNSKEFIDHSPFIVMKFYDDFLRTAGSTWEIDTQDIDEWVEELNDETQEAIEELEEDDRDIKLSVQYQVYPVMHEQSF